MKIRSWACALLSLGALAGRPGVALSEDRPIASGSGVVVSADGHIVTNAHVVDGCDRLTVRLPARGAVAADVIAKDGRNDIAVMRAKLEATAPAALRLSPVRAGETVVAFGFPLTGTLASSGNVTTGIIAALAGLDDDTSKMQITAPIQVGNSGGPVMDAGGRVIGIVVSKLDAVKSLRRTGDVPQNVNFAIKATMLSAFLSSSDVPFLTETEGEKREIPDVVDSARRFTVKVECYGPPARALANTSPPSVQAPNKSNQPAKPKAQQTPHSMVEPSVKTIVTDLAPTMAEVVKSHGRGEAARAIELCFIEAKANANPRREVVLAAIAIDLGMAALDIGIAKQAGISNLPYFAPEAVMRRAHVLLDKISYPLDRRAELIKALLQLGTAELRRHLN